MKKQISEFDIKELAQPLIEEKNVELIDFELKGKPGNQVLRFFIDTESGVTLNLCKDISREISDYLDRKDLIPGKYRLEVSSPGLDRPLKNWKDFRRNVNRKVKIVFKNENEKEVSQTGIIISVNETEVQIKNEETITIALDNIVSAKIEPVW